MRAQHQNHHPSSRSSFLSPSPTIAPKNRSNHHPYPYPQESFNSALTQRKGAAGADGDDAVLGLQHVAQTRDLEGHVPVRHQQRRLVGAGGLGLVGWLVGWLILCRLLLFGFGVGRLVGWLIL
jgi:hypothetical protein